MGRPSIHGSLLAQLTEAAPARLVRKLDADPERAEGWIWSETPDGWEIDAGKAVVTLLGPSLTEPDHLGCTCLLAPRCLHILSVVSRLEVSEGEEPIVEEEAPVESMSVSAAQQEVAGALHRLLVALLDGGFSSAGTVSRGQLLRHAHACRVVHLPRLAGHASRIAAATKALMERAPDFSTADLAADTADALAVAGRIAAGEASAGDVGVGRRRYETLGGLRVTGLFTEPVLTRSGYAGAVTTLVGPDGRLFTVSDVRPGDPERARASYRGGAEIGGTAVSHRDLGRTGLFLSAATASASGRLGRGREVAAVRSGVSEWPDALFERPFSEQLECVLERTLSPPDQRAEGWDLVFVTGGLDGGTLQVGERSVPTRLPSDSEHLCFRDNARVLAGFTGSVRVIARWRPRGLELLALSPQDGGLDLDPEWAGRVNLGLDRLPGSSVVTPGEVRSVTLLDPCSALRRRVHRLLLGGSATLPAAAAPSVLREAQRLQTHMLPTGAGLLVALHRSCGRGPSGTAGASSPERMAELFSAACSYERRVQQHLLSGQWAVSAS